MSEENKDTTALNILLAICWLVGCLMNAVVNSKILHIPAFIEGSIFGVIWTGLFISIKSLSGK